MKIIDVDKNKNLKPLLENFFNNIYLLDYDNLDMFYFVNNSNTVVISALNVYIADTHLKFAVNLISKLTGKDYSLESSIESEVAVFPVYTIDKNLEKGSDNKYKINILTQSLTELLTMTDFVNNDDGWRFIKFVDDDYNEDSVAEKILKVGVDGFILS